MRGFPGESSVFQDNGVAGAVVANQSTIHGCWIVFLSLSLNCFIPQLLLANKVSRTGRRHQLCVIECLQFTCIGL